jgi:hypothetical protein
MCSKISDCDGPTHSKARSDREDGPASGGDGRGASVARPNHRGGRRVLGRARGGRAHGRARASWTTCRATPTSSTTSSRSGRRPARRGPRRGVDRRECPRIPARHRPALGASRPSSARWRLVFHNRSRFGVFYLSTTLDMTCSRGPGSCSNRPGF